MKVPGTRVLLDHAGRKKVPLPLGGYDYESTWPDDPAPLHVLIVAVSPHRSHSFGPRAGKPTVFDDRETHFFEPGSLLQAACGKYCPVLLPYEFDISVSNEADACPRCLADARAYSTTPSDWVARYRSREHRRREREDEHEDIEIYRTQQLWQQNYTARSKNPPAPTEI